MNPFQSAELVAVRHSSVTCIATGALLLPTSLEFRCDAGVPLGCLGSENIDRHEPAFNSSATVLLRRNWLRSRVDIGETGRRLPDVAAAESQTGQREPLAARCSAPTRGYGRGRTQRFAPFVRWGFIHRKVAASSTWRSSLRWAWAVVAQPLPMTRSSWPHTGCATSQSLRTSSLNCSQV